MFQWKLPIYKNNYKENKNCSLYKSFVTIKNLFCLILRFYLFGVQYCRKKSNIIASAQLTGET